MDIDNTQKLGFFPPKAARYESPGNRVDHFRSRRPIVREQCTSSCNPNRGRTKRSCRNSAPTWKNAPSCTAPGKPD